MHDYKYIYKYIATSVPALSFLLSTNFNEMQYPGTVSCLFQQLPPG